MSEIWTLENEDGSQREGHTRLLREFDVWMKQGCPGRIFSVYMCCRYGKCDAIRNMAIKSLGAGAASIALAVHPWPDLSIQFMDQSRLLGWQKRWLPRGPRLDKVCRLSDFSQRVLTKNGEWLGSIHIQALIQGHHRDCFRDWIDHVIHKTGLPPIVFFDEAHHFSKENKWGDVARLAHESGCLCVPLTATPFRNDKSDTWGFMIDPKDGALPMPKTKVFFTPTADPNKLQKNTSVGEEMGFTISADVEVPFAQGWQELHIAKTTFDLIDWNMLGWGMGIEGENAKLSGISKDKAREILPEMYRNPEIIREAARRVNAHLNSFREAGVKDATAIWYGMNDFRSSGKNAENLKAMKDAMLAENCNLTVAIATMSTNDEYDESSSVIIQNFIDEKKKHYDVLGLKQMGTAGLDSDRICVVVLWNPIRSLNQMIQMAMRGGNSALKTHFVIIGLKDRMTVDGLQQFIEDNGGEFTRFDEHSRATEIVNKNPAPRSGYIPIDVAETDSFDSDGNIATWDEIKLAARCIDRFPEIILRRTIPQIAILANSLGMTADSIPDEEVVHFSDSEKIIDSIRLGLNEQVKEIAKIIFMKATSRLNCARLNKDELKHFGIIKKDTQALIKRRSGVYLSWDAESKDRSYEIMDYKKWINAAEALRKEFSQ